MECLSYCIADGIDLARLDQHCKTTLKDYTSNRTRDVLRLTPSQENSASVYIFKNGTVVSWGIKRHEIQHYIGIIRAFANKPISFKVHDEFIYRVGERISIGPHRYFDVDCLIIDHDSDELKLGLSYGFSQSVKLQYFETILETLIESYTPLIHQMSNKDKKTLSISRHQIRQVIGDILIAKSEMNLVSNFLYHPKYFWQHPTLEEYYIMLERYLHLPKRVNALNHRLDTLNEIFDMFNDYLEAKHSHRLEIIIIVLITIEILFSVYFHF